MTRLTAVLLAACAAAWAAAGPALAADGREPIRLHPDNPHYFLWRGKPTVLVTSGEHYGAVLNLDFDYVPYLEELARHGLNQTRTFSGTYREIPGSFKITGNPLAPKPHRFACPWARTKTKGYYDGGGKFDLSKYAPAYFARLKDFLAEASKRGVVVELVLFCPMYNDELWKACPMNARNNVNGVGRVGTKQPLTLDSGGLLEYQLAFVRKIVTECNAFDNLYWEICNEPYFGGVTRAWQQRIAEEIVATEKDLPRKHLIARNIANGSKRVDDPMPEVSILNFHYCSPPKAVAMNRHLGRAVGNDETGFKGSKDVPYRPDGWAFLLAGGAVYSNLDYSFRPDAEDGSAEPKAPGGGGETLRRALGALLRFMNRLDVVRMEPSADWVAGGVPKKATVHGLAEPGRQYALFLRGGRRADLVLDLPKGTYTAEWVDSRTGEVAKRERFDHSGGKRTVASPDYNGEIALRILAR
jgi:hypothetical protein